jgi:hypothetical protein
MRLEVNRLGERDTELNLKAERLLEHNKKNILQIKCLTEEKEVL